MADRIRIVLTIPKDFSEKFANFVNNINVLNSDIEFPILIEKISNIENLNEAAAVPKINKNEGDNIANQD